MSQRLQLASLLEHIHHSQTHIFVCFFVSHVLLINLLVTDDELDVYKNVALIISIKTEHFYPQTRLAYTQSHKED